MPSMMCNIKNSSVVQQKTSNWFARYVTVGRSRHVVLSFLMLVKRVQWTRELVRCVEAQTSLIKCSPAGICRRYTFVLLTLTFVVTTLSNFGTVRITLHTEGIEFKCRGTMNARSNHVDCGFTDLFVFIVFV
jgi:hypothetical protein